MSRKESAALAAHARFKEYLRKNKQTAAAQAEIAYNTKIWAESLGTTVWLIKNGLYPTDES